VVGKIWGGPWRARCFRRVSARRLLLRFCGVSCEAGEHGGANEGGSHDITTCAVLFSYQAAPLVQGTFLTVQGTFLTFPSGSLKTSPLLFLCQQSSPLRWSLACWDILTPPSEAAFGAGATLYRVAAMITGLSVSACRHAPRDYSNRPNHESLAHTDHSFERSFGTIPCGDWTPVHPGGTRQLQVQRRHGLRRGVQARKTAAWITSASSVICICKSTGTPAYQESLCKTFCPHIGSTFAGPDNHSRCYNRMFLTLKCSGIDCVPS
jgi:hypothetical protein